MVSVKNWWLFLRFLTYVENSGIIFNIFDLFLTFLAILCTGKSQKWSKNPKNYLKKCLLWLWIEHQLAIEVLEVGKDANDHVLREQTVRLDGAELDPDRLILVAAYEVRTSAAAACFLCPHCPPASCSDLHSSDLHSSGAESSMKKNRLKHNC